MSPMVVPARSQTVAHATYSNVTLEASVEGGAMRPGWSVRVLIAKRSTVIAGVEPNFPEMDSCSSLLFAINPPDPILRQLELVAQVRHRRGPHITEPPACQRVTGSPKRSRAPPWKAAGSSPGRAAGSRRH